MQFQPELVALRQGTQRVEFDPDPKDKYSQRLEVAGALKQTVWLNQNVNKGLQKLKLPNTYPFPTQRSQQL